MFILVWVFSIIGAMFIADRRGRSVVGFFLLGLFTGPLALMIALLLNAPAKKGSYSIDSLQEARKQLEELKSNLFNQELKIKNLENLLIKLSHEKEDAPSQPAKEAINVSFERVKPEPVSTVSPEPQTAAQAHQEGDMELNFGRNWLNKIGVAVLALGVAFLISYTFRYFGPYLKILFGYTVAGALFYLGFKMETNKRLTSYGRGLLGGAWAIVYFTTYAMHHFDASRIINSQAVDLVLLSLVVIGMIIHVLKYESESMMSVALFVAYMTSTLGHITGFTVLSTVLLGVLALFMVYTFNWVKTFTLSILLTYGVHLVWVAPNLFSSYNHSTVLGFPTHQYHHLLNFIFLTGYALLFFIGIHIAKSKDEHTDESLAGINFGNIAAYSIMAYSLILRLFYQERFLIAVGIGIVYLCTALAMRKLNREKLFISDMAAALFTLTFSITLKYVLTSTLLVWMIEVPCLVFIGFQFKEKLYRYFGYGLSVLIALKIFSFSSFLPSSDVSFFGFQWTWLEFLSLWASVSMGLCFYITQKARNDFAQADQMADQCFCGAAIVYFTSWLSSVAHAPWLPFSLTIEGVILLAAGMALGLKRLRVYGYVILAGAAFDYTGKAYEISIQHLKWFLVGFETLAFFGIYYGMRFIKRTRKLELIFQGEEMLGYWASIILLVFSVHYYILPQWISLTLGISSALLIMIGLLDGGRSERLGGLALLALTLGRVLLIDLSGLDVIFKIITFIILGVLLLGVSFTYNKFDISKK